MIKRFKCSLASVDVDFGKGAVNSISFNDGYQAIYKPLPFFSIKLRNRSGEKTYIDSCKCAFEGFEDGFAVYKHDLFIAKLKISADAVGLIWRINVENKTDSLIEQVELMSIGLCGKLKDEDGGQGEIDIPYNEGVKVTNLSRRLNSPFGYIEPEYPSLGKYFIFPNMISSQFEAYICDEHGIYFGMHDKERTTKHIDFNRYDDALKMQLRAFCNCDYGQDYIMPFDCVMSFFKGNYFDAAEIYRKWFYENLPSGLKPIRDNDGLPSWYKQSPLVVTYPIRGINDGDTIMAPNDALYPYKNALPILKNIQEKTDSKILNLLMHWEGKAPWAPPYYWPPYGGEDLFADYVKAIHDNGMLIGLYTSGLGWTQVSYRGNLNNEDEFASKHLENIMCVNTDGYMKSTIVDNIRLGYDMCPSCKQTKDIIKIETEKILSFDVDYLQVLDQNHGGCSYFCYSSSHGHIPAPGKHQTEEMASLLGNIEHKNALLGCESASGEPLIPYLLFSDNRFILNYYIGTPIPLYSYVYHEFVNNFMGNQICMVLENKPYSYTFRLAYAFTCGDMFTFVLHGDGHLADAWCNNDEANEEVAFAFVKELNKWRASQSKFLHEGKMVKPMRIKCQTLPLKHEDGHVFDFPSILTSAFENDGFAAQFIVNYDLVEHKAIFEKEEIICLDSQGEKHITAKEIDIPPLTVYMIKR